MWSFYELLCWNDLGGTNTKIGIADESGKVLKSTIIKQNLLIRWIERLREFGKQ